MARSRFLGAWLAGGFVFLYAPIVLLVATSFNGSRLMTSWSGLSLRWYAALAQDGALRDAAGLSLFVAAASASLATLLGGLAGLALSRLGHFAGRRLFAGLLAAPLVLPDLLIALALLLLFVALERATGWPAGRGVSTIVLAHATVGMAFVAVAVEARLTDMGSEFEQAAADLGAPPLVALRRITLPLVAPSLAAGWLLAFTLSLDDVVIASFTTGPGATTLPMVIFSTLRLGPTPVLNALATVILALVAGLLLAAWKLAPVARRGPRH
jgi:putrescine transport system permease protein